MSNVIEFGAEPALDRMSKDELNRLLVRTQARLAALDAQEPDDMTSEAYEVWSEHHEKLEDLADDIQDRLDEQ